MTAVTAVGGGTVTLSNTTTSATNVTYTLKFTTTTGLAGDTGSYASIVFPTGSGLASLTSSLLVDGATTIGFCQRVASTLTVGCYLYGGQVAHAGDSLTATLVGVGNPSTTNPYSLQLSTTSDIKVKNVAYCVAATGVPCISKVSPLSGQVGASVAIAGINLAGATAVMFNGTAAWPRVAAGSRRRHRQKSRWRRRRGVGGTICRIGIHSGVPDADRGELHRHGRAPRSNGRFGVC